MDTLTIFHKAGSPNTALVIFETMRAQIPLLDAQVLDCIRASYTGTVTRLDSTQRLGDWYVGDINGEWMQLCVMRIRYNDHLGEARSVLREYAIPARGGLVRLVVIDG